MPPWLRYKPVQTTDSRQFLNDVAMETGHNCRAQTAKVKLRETVQGRWIRHTGKRQGAERDALNPLGLREQHEAGLRRSAGRSGARQQHYAREAAKKLGFKPSERQVCEIGLKAGGRVTGGTDCPECGRADCDKSGEIHAVDMNYMMTLLQL